MTTRELIEAVRKPERRMTDGLVLLGYDENGDPKTAALVTVNATDYDALRAATLAVRSTFKAARTGSLPLRIGSHDRR